MALSAFFAKDKCVMESLYALIKDNPLLQAFKVVEATINTSNGLLADKMFLVVNLLCQILSSNLLKTKTDHISLIFSFFHENILKLILNENWGEHCSIKHHLTTTLNRFSMAVEKVCPTVVKNIQYLITLITNPWGNLTITRIFNEELCVKEEELDLIRAEIEQVLFVRLKILLDAKCEDQAIRLIDVCLKCVRDEKNSFESYYKEIIHLQDLNMILLVKTMKLNKAIEEVKRMGLSESLKMIKRCSSEHTDPKLHKSCTKMISFVATTMMTTAMIEPISEESLLVEIIQQFFEINSNIQLLPQPLKKFLTIAPSSQHMYLLGQVYTSCFGEAGQALCIEIFVRALAVNLNELERYKGTDDSAARDLSECQLYNGFLLLADCFHKDIFLHRECVLTAFSIKPSESCFSILKAIANETNNNEKDLCKKLPSSPLQTGSNMDKFVNKILASPIYIPPAEDLGITQTLCDDLATVIGSARYKQLDWTLGWDQLSKRCESFMEENWANFRNSKKELMFLSIDYNQFKNNVKSE